MAPLVRTRVSPNHLTTLRLLVGVASVAAFAQGTYAWSNLAAAFLVASNFLDHTDGELARLSGKTSRAGHLYDLASDAFVTIALFVAIGCGVAHSAAAAALPLPPVAAGALAGCAVALIFFLRMRIEGLAGKPAARQASFGGFETEDVLYLMPLVTVSNALVPFLTAAMLFAPLFAAWVVFAYARLVRQAPAGDGSSGVMQ